MEFPKASLYKVVELHNAITIIDALARSNKPDAVELITAELTTCLTYMTHYLKARSEGYPMARAHQVGMYSVSKYLSGDRGRGHVCL